ncbi:M4 family metallopeptidase [Actinomadura sp. HBU206391]|uniref:M4 family metallopeptidase n=1 Tax=Actinomadura sp. HBU206391 TaxID=2731692 RepID=UPI001650D2DC|nr:M4 family metallopeptidase [Actinomadura sp. HBU206391]MBC6456538.1 M4 family metallopeptidase [Actinomadura sp. HBU206391]
MIFRREIGYASREHGDRGAGAVEYLGVIVLVVSVAGALGTSGLPGMISGEATQAICRVMQESCDRQVYGFVEESGPHAAERHVAQWQLEMPTGRVAPQTAGGSARPQMPIYVYDKFTGMPKESNLRRTNGNAPTEDPDVNKAFELTTKVGDYFWDRFKRRSYDNKGGRINIQLEDRESSPRLLGVANSIVIHPDFLALDVIGHEFAHGLGGDFPPSVRMPWGESGAIDESIADIFASNIDDNWEIGEDMSVGARRDMSNPGRFGHPAHVYNYVYLKSEGGDDGAHINSGILNYAYYQMVEGEGIGIGRKVAEQIIYRALTKYMTKVDTFEGFRTANLKATRELYRNNDKIYKKVNAAFAKVGLNGSWKSPTHPGRPNDRAPGTVS